MENQLSELNKLHFFSKSILPIKFLTFGTDDFITIHPSTKDPKFLGMALNYYPKEKMYEVVEEMAGEKQNELWVYLETENLEEACNCLLLGNNRTPIKIWN
jgi:hypothetical protein